MVRLGDFKVLTFDCYGTLIDWETGILEALSPFVERSEKELACEEILASFARYESREEAENPEASYPKILARVHRCLAGEWRIAATEEESQRFGRSIADWPAFPDSGPSLQYLKGFYRLVVLSNVDRASFAESEKRLGVAFDHVFTAQDIGSYKPNLDNFRFMLDRLAKERFQKSDILHVAQSLFHDHAPANAVGLASAWIDRRAGIEGTGATPPGPQGARYDFRFKSLEELVAVHRAERGR